MEGAKDNTTMKKTYIKPENTVVRINLESLVAVSPLTPQDTALDPDNVDDEITQTGDVGSREVIRSRGAWEEW